MMTITVAVGMVVGTVAVTVVGMVVGTITVVAEMVITAMINLPEGMFT